MRTRTVVKMLLGAAFVAGSAYLALRTDVGRMLTTAEGGRELVARLDRVVEGSGHWGPVLFAVAYAAGSLVFSTVPFNAAGAFIFGKYAGMCYSFVGCMVGSVVGFFLGRYFLREAVSRAFAERMKWLDEKARSHGFIAVFYLRVIGFPYVVLKYCAAATGIRFRDYFWGTFFGIIPPIVLESFVFGAVKEVLASYRGPADFLHRDIVLPLVLLVASFASPLVFGRIRKARRRRWIRLRRLRMVKERAARRLAGTEGPGKAAAARAARN